jgi:hypothetical protein
MTRPITHASLHVKPGIPEALMRVAIIATAVLLAVTGCGGDDEQTTTEPTSSATDAPSSAKASGDTISSPIVGDWVRMMTCQERVDALKKAGLGQFAAEHVAGNEHVPGISFDEPELIDPKQPCVGAVPRQHGHYFTSDGLFGSTDHKGQQVDEGTFELVNAHTVVITNPDASVTFNFEIKHGELFLAPVMPSCVKTGCWEAQWAVAVASPGHSWRRTG